MFNWVKEDLRDFGKYLESSSDIKKLSLKDIDITFVGSGLASTYTLIEFISQLGDQGKRNQPPYSKTNPIQLIMFEKDSWFWGGIPYGRRSGFTSLIITPLDEFLPSSELQPFIDWMSKNIDWLIVPFRENAGSRSKIWLKDSEEKIKFGKSAGIHIPRYFFGIYLWDKLRQVVNSSDLDLELSFIKREISSIYKITDSKRSGRFTISTTEG